MPAPWEPLPAWMGEGRSEAATPPATPPVVSEAERPTVPVLPTSAAKPVAPAAKAAPLVTPTAKLVTPAAKPVAPVAQPSAPTPTRAASSASVSQGTTGNAQATPVQRAATNRPLQDQMARAPVAAPDPPSPPPPAPDLDALARQIYQRIKQRLAAELRRKG
ncbi:hypothetical protein [Candidatus Viridilinea mediisalina]|uniref:hypothetical protein n=1 Tax=Candidatus Viridilinea mediisalina TaxID=2024553 RepID=UPI000F5AD7A2|nr:hypothetical protein [Candidatus Viridilinea mediisalina]